MKIWHSYGSEHSMDLVLIGTFESVTGAQAAVDRMAQLKELAEQEWDDDWERDFDRLPSSLSKALLEWNLVQMGRPDVDIYAYEHVVKHSGTTVQVRTEEGEVQGFLKLLLHFGARVEVFSRHNWLDDGSPRRAEAD